MVVKDRMKELETNPAAKIHKIEEELEGKSLDPVNNCEQDDFVTFLVQIEKMNSGVEKIEENNQKIKETQKHFFDEPSTAGREMYQAEHKNLMKVSKDFKATCQHFIKLKIVFLGCFLLKLSLSRKIKGLDLG